MKIKSLIFLATAVAAAIIAGAFVWAAINVTSVMILPAIIAACASVVYVLIARWHNNQ